MSPNRISQGDDGQWYFKVRGNQSMGPYPSHQDAAHALNVYVSACQERVEGRIRWPRFLHPLRLRRHA
ncbi:MAG: hypothetical protein CMQ49_09490 [Gammaproteobacteria bacterium]|nr:hypothetical protein [Gammaproteobacteria bacterium]|tara:strand:- start:8775 stop:8978 length:204 start_codon:yes stop_codon:yes gene_type:complete